ncbi:MAG TPA: tetratricopeptide repeat protein [Polyangiaceae bacterium]|nr:tetratricopeptide repeat protein [Polyangiaceae bacterium]
MDNRRAVRFCDFVTQPEARIDATLEERSQAPRPWLIALLVCSLTLVAYLPVVEGPFIWDDYQLIFDSPRVQELKPLSAYWGTSFWTRGDIEPSGRNYYRPLAIFSLALDHAVHGENPAGYHVTNALFHGANTLLLFGLLRRRKLAAPQAGLLALGWGLFPRLTEAAAWISGRTDVLAGFFSLLALFLAARDRVWTRWAAAASALLGLFAKEVALAALVGVALSEWFAARGASPPKRVLRIVPAALSGVAYFGTRLWAMGIGIRSNNLSWPERIISGTEALGRYVAMLFDGWRPCIQIGFLGAPSWPHVALGGAVALAGVGFVAHHRRKLDAQSFSALAVFALSLGLVLHIVPITVNIVAADRFMYLPLAALVLLLSPLANRPLRHPACIGLGVLCVSYGVATFHRARTWADEVDFWTTAFREERDHNATSRLELGNVYGRAGLHNYAIALQMSADTGDYQNFLLASHNAAMRFVVLGRYAEARAILEQLVREMPQIPKFHYALAALCVAEHKFEEADKHLTVAERLYPDSTSVQKLRRAMRELRAEEHAPVPDLSTLNGKLENASRIAVYGRAKEALDLLVAAAASPEITAAQLTDPLLYAFDWGTPRQLTALYERYRAVGGDSPTFAENYRLRMERVARLKALWPSLADNSRAPLPAAEPSARER